MSTTTTHGPADAATMPRAAIRRRLLGIGRPVIAPLFLSAIFRTVQLACGLALLAVGAWGVGTTAADIAAGRGADSGLFWTVVWVMVGLSLAKGLTRYLEQFCGHLVAFKALALLRTYFFDAMEPQAPAAVEGRRSGDLLSRVTKDVDRVEVFFAHTLVPAVTAVVVPVGTVIALAVLVHPAAALVLVPFLVAVGVLVPWLGQRGSERAAARLRETRGRIAQHTTDTVQGVREVLAFQYGPRRLDELGELDDRAGGALRTIGARLAARRGLNSALVAAAVIAQFAVIGNLVLAGTVSWTWAVVALAITVGAFVPVLAVEDFSADLDQAYTSARRIFEVTDAPPVVADPIDPATVTGIPAVTFEAVGFAYPAGPEAGNARVERVVDDVTFTVPAGSTTALVGASGSGKSTLASLLERYWDVDAGAIRVGGVDLRELAIEDLRSMVALSPQRPYLFNDTIEANLRIARPDATAEQLAHACRVAALDEVVAAEPDGLGTVVGEMGERLSGGQRQRIAIARAVLRDAPILVLDEATSQLDAGTEATILASLRAEFAGRTVLVIAHRLSTITDADEIVVMDAGRVVDRGRHIDLAARPGPYATLLGREADSLK